MSEDVKLKPTGKDRVTLKWGGKAVLNGVVVGTWDFEWSRGAYKFDGKTNEGLISGLMKKRELREWFAKECSK